MKRCNRTSRTSRDVRAVLAIGVISPRIDDDVQVRTEIKVPNGGPPLTVDYSMYKASAAWKIYDVTVEGVSLLTTYRSTFAEEIRQGGIDGLIKSLQDKVSAPAAGTKKQQ